MILICPSVTFLNGMILGLRYHLFLIFCFYISHIGYTVNSTVVLGNEINKYRISEYAISLLIPEVCAVLYEVLKEEHFRFPTSTNEWLSIAEQFEDRWNFPNCFGAMDGKHIAI